ncbi:AAA family ATPase [Rhizobium sp. KVB221]|uniref:AAA family ATPase n=1 Tax=Rhizobium setariae TaxID=2801340 RepID=A0A937CKQ8_9HYPH|nr:AAA family ATPase [Rhizobium setariae]MBL0370731.1 AAA family ATPase [Rhizobium setariae]
MSELDYGFQRVHEKCKDLIMLTGCSGGGKSTLLSELDRRGYHVFEEPGRQIVKEQDLIDGPALPWPNPEGFAELCLSRSMHNLALALKLGGQVFFDRGIVDALASFEHLGLPVPEHFSRAAERLRYCKTVFVLPPWPEIFTGDAERRHSADEAVDTYHDLVSTYERLGYELVAVPKVDAAARADFVLDHLAKESTARVGVAVQRNIDYKIPD